MSKPLVTSFRLGETSSVADRATVCCSVGVRGGKRKKSASKAGASKKAKKAKDAEEDQVEGADAILGEREL
eukprot:708374-Pyramimonas_sp.AAC.1